MCEDGKMRGKGLRLCWGGLQNRWQEKFLHWKGSQAVEQAAQGRGGITIPGRVQNQVNVELEECGLVVNMVVLCQRVGLKIFEVFSSLNGFCDFKVALPLISLDYTETVVLSF